MAVAGLTSELVALLADRPHLTASRLAVLLVEGSDPFSIEEVLEELESQPNLFESDGDDPPRWSLRHRSGPSGASGSATDSQSPRLSHQRLYAWQQDALAAWHERGSRGVIEAVTGTGKTMVGLAAIADELERRGKVLVVVPTVELQRQWCALLKHHGRDLRIGTLGGGSRAGFLGYDVLVAVVNSARDADLEIGPDSLIVADECHRYGSECNAAALDPRFTRRLGLSATYVRPDEGHERILDPYFGGVCYSMGYRRAIDDGVIARFAVALVGTQFAPEERSQYDLCTEDLVQAREALIGRFQVPAEPIGEFMREVGELAREDVGLASIVARRFMSAFSERARILAETPSKMSALRKVAPSIVGADRTIVFTRTIAGARLACAELRRCGLQVEAVHSEQDPGERRRVLDAFQMGRLKAIVAPQVLDEGIDVPAADLAIIVASSKSRRQMVQRMGRVIRRKEDGRVARFAVLFVEGTIEDPATGAHETFLEEVIEVAERVEQFDASATMSAVCGMLLDLAPKSCSVRRAPPRPLRPHESVVSRFDRRLVDAPPPVEKQRETEQRVPPWRQDRALEATVLLVRERDTPFSRDEVAVLRPRLERAVRDFRRVGHRVHAGEAPGYAESAVVCEEALAKLDTFDPAAIERARREAAEREATAARNAAEAQVAELARLREEIEEARRRIRTSQADVDSIDAAIRQLRALRLEEWQVIAEAWQLSDVRAASHNTEHARNAVGGALGEVAMGARVQALELARRVKRLAPDVNVLGPVESYLLALAARGRIEGWRYALMKEVVGSILSRAMGQ